MTNITTPTERQCKTCNSVKPITDYYPVRNKTFRGSCKACCILQINGIKKKHEETNPDYRSEQRIKYSYKSDRWKKWYSDNKEVRLKEASDYIQRYPEKYKAAIAICKIPKLKGYNLHHWSYKDHHKTDVIPLKTRHHHKAHRFIIYDQCHFQYRRLDTNELLDTREKHESYIIEMIENMPD